VFEPLVEELVRSRFFIPIGPADRDSMTPSVISAAGADYQRNLANTVDLACLLVNDNPIGADNRTLFLGWLAKHGNSRSGRC
jgi:propane monooxygenase small subunit